MTPTHTIDVVREMAAPVQAVWDRVSDHAATHTWVLLARVRLLEQGTPPPNGVGGIRQVSFPSKRLWSTIDERIVAFDPPRTFAYEIIRGMPGLRGHRGTLTVDAIDATRSRLTWHIDFEFSRLHPFGWIAGPFTRTFRGVIQGAVDELARQLAT